MTDRLEALFHFVRLAVLREGRATRDIMRQATPTILCDWPAKLPRGAEVPESTAGTPEWKAIEREGLVKRAPKPAGRWMATARGSRAMHALAEELFRGLLGDAVAAPDPMDD